MDKQNELDNEEDLDCVDFNNYKGMFYDNNQEKYQDEITGAHFEYSDMCRRLRKLKSKIQPKENNIKKEKSEIILKDTKITIGNNPLNMCKSKESRNELNDLDKHNYYTAGINATFKEINSNGKLGSFIKKATQDGSNGKMYEIYNDRKLRGQGIKRTKTTIFEKPKEDKVTKRISNGKTDTMNKV